MENANHISDTLDDLKIIWEYCPHLSLVQLLNLLNKKGVGYIKDEDLIASGCIIFDINPKCFKTLVGIEKWCVRDDCSDEIIGYFNSYDEARNYALNWYEKEYGEEDRTKGTYDELLADFRLNKYKMEDTFSIEQLI